MTDKLLKEKMILVSGLVGIAAAILTIISDIILLGRPNTAISFFRLGTECMAGLPHWRITIGTFLGVFALPLQIAGIVPLYFGLLPAGKKLAVVFLGSASYAMIMGVAFHTSYAYIGSGWKMLHETEIDNLNVQNLMLKFGSYWMTIIVSVFAMLLIASVCCVILLLSGKTLFPKWMALINPICVFAAMFPLIAFIPAPIGGYISPTYLNLSSLILFIFSLKFIRKKPT